MQLSSNKALISVVLCTVAFLLLPSALFAADPEPGSRDAPIKVTPEELDGLPTGEERYEVEVHVKSIISSILITQELRRRALFSTNELKERAKVLETGCRVKLIGYIGLRSRRHIVFYIEDFERLETDIEKLADAVYELDAEDGMGHIRLAEEALQKAAITKDTELEDAAIDLLTRGIMLEERKIDKKNPDDLVRIALLYGDKLGVQTHAFRLLNEALRLDPKHQGTLETFRKLGAHFYQGRWISHEEFMVAEGFVLVNDKWIRVEEKHFHDAVEQRLAAHERDPIVAKRLRLLPEDTYRRAVTEHKVLIGMSRKEVASSLGYPEMVERTKTKGRTFGQWIYRDQYVYFEDGTVFLKEKR
ncbi:MAG: tetratricopeptide repeat protein [Planctomycetota bacterium]|jgi:tetratricopeptide (TPR) repeat protein